MLCRGCASDKVVCGAADMPITPPVSRHRHKHLVRLHPRRIPDGPRARVSDEDRLVAVLAHIQRGPVGGMRDVDGQAELVHPGDGPPAERGQPTVGGLAQTAAERVGVGVGDADLPDTEAVQDVEPIDLVLDGRRRLQPEYQADPAGPVRLIDVGHGADDQEAVGVGEVGLPHAEVGDDVVPPPRRVAGNARGAVHHVVEDDGHAGSSQPGVGGVLAAGAVVLGVCAIRAGTGPGGRAG